MTSENSGSVAPTVKQRKPRGAGAFRSKPKAPIATPSQEGAKRNFGSATADTQNVPSPPLTQMSQRGNTESVTSPALAALIENEIPTFVLPTKITPWKFQDRQMAELDGDNDYEDLVDEIRAYWVISPILVRKLSVVNPEGYEYEEIAGFKRLSAAMRVNPSRPMPVVVKELSDLEALQLQRSENEGRSRPCQWSMANFYKLVLAEGLVKTTMDLAAMYKIDRTSASHYIRIAEDMPQDFIDSFDLYALSLNALRSLVAEINKEVGTDRSELIDRIVELADSIAKKPDNAVKLIEKCASDFRSRNTAKTEPPARKAFNSQKGKVLTTKQGATSLSFTLHEAAIDPDTYGEVESAILAILEKKGLKMAEKL